MLMALETPQGRADSDGPLDRDVRADHDAPRKCWPSFARSTSRPRKPPGSACSTAARHRLGRRQARRCVGHERRRPQDDRRRALGRLGPDRQRRRPEARALRPGHRRPARAAGDVGAGARRLGRPTRPSFPAPTRRAAGAGSSTAPVPRELAAGARRRSASTPSLTPFRHLGFFPDMAPQWDWMRERAADADVLNLFGYTGVGTPAAERGRRAAGPCRRVEEIGRGRQGQCRSVGPGRPADPLDRRRRRASSPRARSGAGGATTASCSTRPSSAAGPRARCGGWRSISRRLLADCRRLLDEDSRFLVLTVYAVRMSALAIGELLRQVTADLGGTVEVRRNGGARGSARPAAADRDLRALVATRS